MQLAREYFHILWGDRFLRSLQPPSLPASVQQQKMERLLAQILSSGGSEVRHNPWYAPVSPTEPAVLEPAYDEQLLNLVKSSDCEAIRAACSSSTALVNTTRAMHGETLLHNAVIGGNPEVIVLLVNECGAYVNATDYRDNTPLYYAATHPGEGDCLKNDEDKRCLVIQTLLDLGADTMRQGGFSGKRPFEQAKTLGYLKAARLIEESPVRPFYCKVRDCINMMNPPAELAVLVELYIELFWGTETASWFIRISRHNMSQCFKPKPELVERFDGTLQEVEKMFREYQDIHAKWWAALVARSKQ